MSETRVIRAKRLGYSRSPWRLVDSATGKEISFPVVFDHPQLGPCVISAAGFDTKAEAIEYLGVIAARTLDDS